MSPRAAVRLDMLGFEAYDYAGGKSDWRSSGLPMERHGGRPPMAVDAVHEVATCRPEQTIGDVRKQLEAEDGEVCVVTNEDGIVLGRLRSRQLDADPDARVDAVMESGPTSVRADSDLDDLAGRMERASVDQVLVTVPDGTLLGVVTLAGARAALGS